MADDFFDIKDESYSDALQFGNLGKKPKDELERFVSDGYIAAIHICKCQTCGSISRELGGIFHHETGSKGSVRSINIFGPGIPNHAPQIPLTPQNKPVTYLGTKTKVCVNCVGAYGFAFDPDAEARSIE